MLNILPWREQHIQRHTRYVLGMLGVLCFSTTCILCLLRSYLQAQICLLTQKINYLEHEIVKKIELKQLLARQCSKKIQAPNVILMPPKPYHFVKLLENLCNTLPGNSYMTSISYDQKGLLLEGISLGANQAALQEFIKTFQKTHQLLMKNFKTDVIQMQKIMFKILFEANSKK
jgi:Tfp pilus assembly protein PilN